MKHAKGDSSVDDELQQVTDFSGKYQCQFR
jgi:hypothetical protein